MVTIKVTIPTTDALDRPNAWGAMIKSLATLSGSTLIDFGFEGKGTHLVYAVATYETTPEWAEWIRSAALHM